MRVDRLPYDLKKIRRDFQRLQATGRIRACYKASGAGYVLQRALTEWGVPCGELAAPSLIPRRAAPRTGRELRLSVIGRCIDLNSLPSHTHPCPSVITASGPTPHHDLHIAVQCIEEPNQSLQ